MKLKIKYLFAVIFLILLSVNLPAVNGKTKMNNKAQNSRALPLIRGTLWWVGWDLTKERLEKEIQVIIDLVPNGGDIFNKTTPEKAVAEAKIHINNF